jgi:hypothetical protein
MDIASTPAIERVARVLAGQHLSRNSGGEEEHAANAVDAHWRDYVDDATAVLKTLREPDADMERAGDIAIWQRMIAAALGETNLQDDERADPPTPGTDPLHEGP